MKGIDYTLWGVVLLAIFGVIWFGMKPKLCIDKSTGESRSTHRFFPCSANETSYAGDTATSGISETAYGPGL